MANLPFLAKAWELVVSWVTSFRQTFFSAMAKIMKIFPFAMKIISFVMIVYFLDALLAPALSHLVVIRNTITFFLTNTGLIWPITINFFYIAIATFIYFLITRNVLRFWFS